MPEDSAAETVVAEPGWVWALVWAGFPVLGAGAGLLLVAGAEWVTTLPWAPMQGLFELIEKWSGPPLTIGVMAVGAIVGLIFAATGWDERLTVRVSPHTVRAVRGKQTQEVTRAEVAAAFVDDKHLVLQDRSGLELVRAKSDLSADALAQAFRSSGYPWLDADPYAGEFTYWVEDAHGLPPGANALLRARSLELAKDGGGDAELLRRELLRLGVVVRDEKKRQYWRLVS